MLRLGELKDVASADRLGLPCVVGLALLLLAGHPSPSKDVCCGKLICPASLYYRPPWGAQLDLPKGTGQFHAVYLQYSLMGKVLAEITSVCELFPKVTCSDSTAKERGGRLEYKTEGVVGRQ